MSTLVFYVGWDTSALSTSRAGRHLWRPYGAEDIGAAYDANMTDARGELTAQWMIKVRG